MYFVSKSWKPISYVNIENLKDVIATIYKNILNSNVNIEIIESENSIVVKDNDCPLCKYNFDDIDIAGCELIIALVAEFINRINEIAGVKSISLEPVGIQESRTLGHSHCIQNYRYLGGR